MPEPGNSSEVTPERIERKRYFRFWLGLAISTVFLYLALRQVDFVEVFDIIVQMLPEYLLLSVLLLIVNMVLRAVRWKLILDPVKDVRLYSMFAYLMIGYMVNNVLPFRVGEIGRSVLLGEKEHLSKSSALASVVVERGFDLMGLVAYLPILFTAIAMPSSTMWRFVSFGLVGLALLLIFYVLVVQKELTMRLASWALRIVPENLSSRFLGLLDTFLRGLDALRSMKRVLAVFSLSAFIWLLSIFATSLRFEAFHLDLPLEAALLCVVAVNLAGALPSSPGQIGVAHYAYVFALSFFAVDRETAVAFGIISHGLIYVCTTFPGLFFGLREGALLGFRDSGPATGTASDAAADEDAA